MLFSSRSGDVTCEDAFRLTRHAPVSMRPTFPRSSEKFLPLLVRALAPGLLLLSATPAAAASDWQSLLGNSPFGPAASAANVPAAGELEFRGVVQDNGVYYVNLFNPATKTAQWIEVHGQTTGIQVNSYDSQTGRVSITHSGRQLTLPFKQTRVALQEAPPPQPAPPAAGASAQPQAGEQPGQPAAGQPREFFRNLPPDARAMIEEFRRRRAAAAAERAQQQQSQGAAGSKPPPLTR